MTRFVIALAVLLAAGAARAVTVADIFHEIKIEGMRPALETLSPDERWVAYAWNAEGRETPLDLYLVPAAGGAARALTSFAVENAPAPATADSVIRRLPNYFQDDARGPKVEAVAWAPDSRRLALLVRGDLYVCGLQPGTLRRLTYTRASESEIAWSPDGERIAFVRDRTLWLLEVARGLEVQLTEAAGDSLVPSSVVWSPDGRRIAFITRDDRGRRDLVIPHYLDERVVHKSVKEGFPDMGARIVEVGDLEGEGAPSLRKADELFRNVRVRLGDGKHPYITAIAWAPDGARLAITEILADMRTRHLHVARADSGSVRTVYTEAESAWIEEFDWVIAHRPVLEWSPDGTHILFLSERTGFNHVVSLPVADEAHAASVRLRGPLNLTGGAWEAGWARWMPDGEQVLVMGSRGSSTERHLDLVVAGGDAGGGSPPRRLATAPGMNTHPMIGRRGERVVYRHSRFDQPYELWSLDLRRGGKPVRLTHTVPARFHDIEWVVPEIVSLPSRDGLALRGLLYKPRDFDPRRRYPVVVFVHGAGSMQNVVDGWTIYSPNFKFHTVLAERGFAVFEVDYRGSLGYGRDFRTGVKDFIGGKDLDDELAGVDYLRTLPWVDAARIGIYGGSYGGFMTLSALFRAPQVYACGAALRFVADWANYYRGNPWYCVQRLGHPDKNAAAYHRSSPIHFAARLEDPLLLLHGVRDDNVHFQDAVQLTERLIRLGKKFDLMMYPRESHGFTAAASWIDQYSRIAAFFDQHLRPGSPPLVPTDAGGGGATAPPRE
jgi:dipeptidyl aminopeptidase/acylaminoacyl peptidase